jgi:hypothetical protein
MAISTMAGSTRPAGEVLSNGDCDDPGYRARAPTREWVGTELSEAVRYCRYLTQIFR